MLAIHSKKKKKSQEIHSLGMNFSEPGNEQRDLEVIFDRLDERCQSCPQHTVILTTYATLPAF